MPTLIPDLVTLLSVEQIVAGVRDGYEIVMGSRPSAPCHAVLCGQICLETGNGRHCHRFNPGNRKVREDDQYYTQFVCNEIINGRPQYFYPPHPQTHFAAFLSAADGMADYFRLFVVTARDRYTRAWSKAYAGNAIQFVVELGRAGYFTGNPVKYAHAVDSISKKLLPLCGSNDPLSDEDRDHIGEQVALSLVGELGAYEHHRDRWVA